MGFFGSLIGGGKKSQASSSSYKKTTSGTAQRIKSLLAIRHLEPMPIQAARAFQLASDPKANSSDFVGVIEADEALSSRIIRIANSVYYMRGEKAKDIEQAVANIGLEELGCILSAIMLRSLMRGKSAAREQAWSNAVATAICCRELSTKTKKIKQSEAFLSGLVHDVGKLVMIQKDPKRYGQVIDRVANGEKTFLEAEDEVFETDHVEVGKWVAEVWNFPAPAIEAIAHHHRAWPKNGAQIALHSSLVKVADAISHVAGIGHPSTFRGFRESFAEQAPEIRKVLGVSNEELDNIIETVKRSFDDEYTFYSGQNA